MRSGDGSPDRHADLPHRGGNRRLLGGGAPAGPVEGLGVQAGRGAGGAFRHRAASSHHPPPERHRRRPALFRELRPAARRADRGRGRGAPLADRAERPPAHQRADQFRQRGPRPCDLRHSAALSETGDSGRAQRPVRRFDRGGLRRRAAHPHQPAGLQPDRPPPQQHHAVGLCVAQLSQARWNAEDAGGSEVARMPDLHPSMAASSPTTASS